jgi:hypothetical protein
MENKFNQVETDMIDSELKKTSKKIQTFAVLTRITALILGISGITSIIAMCGLMSAGAAVGSYIFFGASLAGFLTSFGVGTALLSKEDELEEKINHLEFEEGLANEHVKLKSDLKTQDLEEEYDEFKPEITHKEKPEIQKQKFEPKTDEDVRSIGDGL